MELDWGDSIEEFDAEIEAEEAADLFCEGFLAFSRGEPRPTNTIAAEGWDDAQRTSRVRVVMPARPEGYYHMPLGTFD